MKTIFIITVNTFREFIRDRIFYAIIVVSILFSIISLLLGQLTYIQQSRIALDLGLAFLEFSTIILAIFLGSTIIFREIEKQTVFTLLIRPITRGQFLIGKFLGLLAIVISALVFLSLVLLVILYQMTNLNFDWSFLAVIYGFCLQAAVLISITMVLGVIVRPILTVPLTIGALLIGKWTSTLYYFLDKSEVFQILNKMLPYMIPSFERWDWKSEALQEVMVLNIDMIIYASIYAFSWICVLQAITYLIFRKKDLV